MKAITANRHERKRFLISFAVLCGIVAAFFLVLMFLPDPANAEGYLNFDPARIFSADSSDEGTGQQLANGMVNIANMVITSILLPVGILLSAWRVIYLAIACMMVHKDPLDMLRSGRYTRDMITEGSFLTNGVQGVENFFGGKWGDTAGGAFDNDRASNPRRGNKFAGSALDASYFSGAYVDGDKAIADMAHDAIKIEVKHMFVAMFIVFAVWVVLKLLLRLAVVLLAAMETMVD